MKRSKAFAAIAVLGVGAPTGFSASALAQAQEPAWYLGASVGHAKWNTTCGNSGVSCDEKDTAWKLFFGYQFNRYLAAEGAYADLGKATSRSSSATGEAKSSAWELVGVGSYAIGAPGFVPYAKLGFYRARTDGSVASTSGNVSLSESEANTDWTAGLGVRYDFRRDLAVRAEWQHYNSVGGDDIADSDIDTFSLGVLYKF